MKKVLIFTVLLATILIVACKKSDTTEIVKTDKQKPAEKNWGAFTGGNDSTMATFEDSVGKPMKINAVFWAFDSDFPVTATGSQGKKVLLFWEPAFHFDSINDGSMDGYIATFADSAKAYGYPILLAPFDEFNIAENAWGNAMGTNTPQKFIDAWIRVHDIFVAHHATNVSFVLVYNNETTPSGHFSDFYPGDAYVDSIGVDGFNFGANGPGGLKTFAQVFDSALIEAEAFGKPVLITSVGSVMPQSQFIHDLGASGKTWVWFNADSFVLDATSIPAFKQIIQ